MTEPVPSPGAEPADDDGHRGPETYNTVFRPVAGNLVQAGTMRDVHLHAPLPPAPVVPRQLPAAADTFAGRGTELAELDQTLNACGRETVVIWTISGAGGIGKTWLAVAWANRHADRFPDGQLFVDLHGFSPAGEPTSPADALRGFLHSLGVDPDRVPKDLTDQVKLYRSLIADRRMLIVLDNAADSGQVISLLPGGSSCTVLVTSRNRMVELAARHGARALPLDILTDAEAHALLVASLGRPRISAEEPAVTELVELCGRFPLALALIAARARGQPHVPLAEVVAELREFGLGALHDAGHPTASLPAVLSWSLRHLTREQRRLFALLGMAPGRDIGLPAAAALTGRSRPRARAALRALEDVSLLNRQARDRYSMHDLIRDYAATVARRGLIKVRRTAAVRRMVDFYLGTASIAAHLLDPWAPALWSDVHTPTFVTRAHPLTDTAAALAWLDAEHANLMAALHTATVHRWHNRVWLLTLALESFQLRRGHRVDALVAARAAMNAIHHLNDPGNRHRAHLLLGQAYSRAGRYEEATRHLHEALTLIRRYHEPSKRALAHILLAESWSLRGHHDLALDHAERALACYHSRYNFVSRLRTRDDPTGVARALNLVGRCAAQLGEYGTARAQCEAALALYRRHRHFDGEAAALDSLGFIDHRAGNHQLAIDHYRQSLDLLHDLGDIFMAADTLERVGHPHLALGQPDQARAAWQEALALYRYLGRDTYAQRLQRQLDQLLT